jgi:hypothetical protein
MLSSLNAFGGLSAANLLALLGANSSSSSSNSTSTSAAQSASTGVSASGANDPAKAIKAILAQAQMETSGGGSVSIVTADAAYAAQTVGSSSGAVPEIDNGVTGNASSLVVGTASGTVSVTMGDADQAVMGYRSSEALESYQNLSQQLAQEELAASSIPSSASRAPSASASDRTSDFIPGSGYLQLSIFVNSVGGSGQQDVTAYVQAQAQQLMGAFENNTLEYTSNNMTGFSYAGVYDGRDFVITGIEVPDSKVSNNWMTPITENSKIYNGDFKGLIKESTAWGGSYASAGVDLTFAVPLGNV